MTELKCWFLERHQGIGAGRWFSGFKGDKSMWTDDPSLAVRFVAYIDAVKVADVFWILREEAFNIRPTPHIVFYGLNVTTNKEFADQLISGGPGL